MTSQEQQLTICLLECATDGCLPAAPEAADTYVQTALFLLQGKTIDETVVEVSQRLKELEDIGEDHRSEEEDWYLDGWHDVLVEINDFLLKETTK